MTGQSRLALFLKPGCHRLADVKPILYCPANSLIPKDFDCSSLRLVNYPGSTHRSRTRLIPSGPTSSSSSADLQGQVGKNGREPTLSGGPLISGCVRRAA